MRRAALAPIVLTLAGPALAQGAGGEDLVPSGGQTLTFTIGQHFEADSNLELEDSSPGTSYFTDTRLGLGYLNESPTQVFALDLETGLRALWQADEDFEFTAASPSTASAAYFQEWANAALDTRVRYRQERTGFDRPFDDFLDPDTGVPVLPEDPEQLEGDTTERRFDARIGLELATDAPSSYAFGLEATRLDYSDEGEDLTPRDTVAADATWTLQVTPVIGTALTGRYLYYQAEDEEETRVDEAEVDASVVYTPSATLRVTAGVGFVDRQQEENGEVVEDDAGPSLRASLRYGLEDLTVNGNVRWTNVPESRVSGDLRFIYPLINSQVTGRVFQRYGGGSGGSEIRVIGAAIGLLRELDAVSRIEFDLAASRREDEDEPDEPETDRIEFTSTYSYDFTEGLTGDVGYRYRSLAEGDEDADSHAVFVQISRTFVTRP